MPAIVHGDYRTETAAGFVADFCPVCREIQTFHVIRVGDISHVAFISLGNGRLAGYLIRCAQCGTGRALAENRYASIAEKSADIDSLIAITHPNIRAHLAERLELEARLHANLSSLSFEQRETLLIEPFSELDREIEQLDKGTLHQKQASMWGMLTMSAVIGAGGCAIRFRDDRIGWVVGAGVIAFVAVWAGILIVTEARGMRERIIPSLVRALKPLRPAREELDAILRRCRNAGLISGKKVKLDSLWNALQSTSTYPDRR